MIVDSSRAQRFHRKTATALTEINVTPFVDVMLVLLIIFMVTAPLLKSGVAVELPKEDTGKMEISEENVVTIRGDGALFFNDKRLTQRSLIIDLNLSQRPHLLPKFFCEPTRRFFMVMS